MVPRTSLAFCVCGDLPVVDASQFNKERWDHPEYQYPEVVLVWGNDVIKSNGDGFLGHWIVDMMTQGDTKLIVVDPDLTWLASRADIWIQPRPGVDSAIAMAMTNVIIQEDLYDHDFVENWTYGFDKLVERVKDMTPEKAAEIAWVDAEDIRQAARMFAAANPGALQWGLTTDMRVNGISEAHCLMSLNAICGNVEAPGGNFLAREVYHMNLAYLCGYFENLDVDMRAKRLGNDISPMHQFGLSSTAASDVILQAIECGDPYPVKMLWFQGCNSIANMAAEAPRVYEAIKSTEFNVVVDYCITPTAVACADVVLPCAMSPERNQLRTWWTPLRQSTRVVEYYESKTDEQIILELGRRLNPDAWPYETDIDLLNARLEEGGVPEDFAGLQEMVWDWPEQKYHRHELGLLRPDGQPGFNTPTGRVELYCTDRSRRSATRSFAQLRRAAREPATPRRSWLSGIPASSSPRGTAPSSSSIPSTGNQKTMREYHPLPRVRIHPETAAAVRHTGRPVGVDREPARTVPPGRLGDRGHEAGRAPAPNMAGGSRRPRAPSPTCTACSTRTSTTSRP